MNQVGEQNEFHLGNLFLERPRQKTRSQHTRRTRTSNEHTHNATVNSSTRKSGTDTAVPNKRDEFTHNKCDKQQQNKCTTKEQFTPPQTAQMSNTQHRQNSNRDSGVGGIPWFFDLDLQPFGANLKSVHRLNGVLCRFSIVVTNKSCWGKNEKSKAND